MQVSMMMVRALAGALEREGVSRERFLELAGLEQRSLEDAHARLSVGAYLRALDAALTVSGDPALGLHMGEHASPVMFDVLGPLAENAATLRQGIETLGRYSRLVAEGHDPQLVEAGEVAAIRFLFLRGNLPAVRLTAEFAMTGLLSMLRRFIGHLAEPHHVRFAYDAPPYAAEYERIFGAVVRFAQQHTEIEFPSVWLDRTHAYQSPDLHALLKTRAETMLGRLQREAALSQRVLQSLSACDPRQMPTMDDVARELGISARSLRRKLAAEGSKYGNLVERTLMNEAKRRLEDPRVSIQETAYAMGFAAPAAFHRAFKRWTGLTPKQYQSSF
jgi:AraC-like DNA-binding protein